VTHGRYRTAAVRNDPPPLQRRLPILVGGTGRKVTLRLTALYADLCNLGTGDPDDAADVEATLARHCRDVGRDERQIERTIEIQRVVIRDSREEALRVQDAILTGNGGASTSSFVPGSTPTPAARGAAGTVDDVVAHIRPYLALGYRHLIAGFPAPYDEESMVRFATEVKPRLDALL
jgi:alkanesulfonate monooxygenase SsuD/methylene tetrahydromethanopterin reductase-like flavin-dependent oxidoreductase (luciferase family)